MKNLANKTVLLTGAAGGIGACIARQLIQAQANIICVGRSADTLHKLVAELAAKNGQAIAHPFDLKNLALIPTLISDIEQPFGPIDVLINNAAVEKFRAFQVSKSSSKQ